jgi:NTE family protein
MLVEMADESGIVSHLNQHKRYSHWTYCSVTATIIGMETFETQNLIEQSLLFRHMQPHETEAILARLQSVHYPSGTRILERGVWHGRLYIIVSGEVSVLLHDNDAPSTSDSYVVAHLGRGECFGEMSLITGELPTATIRAEQDVMLWSLTQMDFLALIGTCPTLLQNINAILARRLARVNEHLLSRATAEGIMLMLIDAEDTPVRRSLSFHIADALAMRTGKRVLLLELCARDEAIGLHFATNADQVRPSLLECTRNHTSIEVHRGPTPTSDGQSVSALAVLADTDGEIAKAGAAIWEVLDDLAALYDYMLLVVTQSTPPTIVQALVDGHVAPLLLKRDIALVAAEDVERAANFSFFGRGTSDSAGAGVFVTHTPGLPTVGLQDHYAAQLGRSVTRLLPADDTLLEQCWRQGRTLYQCAPNAALTRAVDFVARFIAKRTVGIAFGGGGARGFAHLGVLDGLLKHEVPLDYIAACSSGIITPGMYLIGKSVAESEEIFLEIQRHIVQWRFPRTSLFSNRGLKQMLRDLCGERRFEDLTTPFAMVAVDLTTRAGVVLDHGPLWQAGLASVALPGFFPPVLVGEHILMDAGMHDPVPIRLVRRMGADILLASELGGQEPPTLENATPWLEEASRRPQKALSSPHIVDLLLRTYDLTMATIGMHSIREADVVIRPKLHRISLRQFSEGRKFVSAGREAVEQAVPELRKYLPWMK